MLKLVYELKAGLAKIDQNQLNCLLTSLLAGNLTAQTGPIWTVSSATQSVSPMCRNGLLVCEGAMPRVCESRVAILIGSTVDFPQTCDGLVNGSNS